MVSTINRSVAASLLQLIASARASHELSNDIHNVVQLPATESNGAFATGAATAQPHAPNRNALMGRMLTLGIWPMTLMPFFKLADGCGIPLMQTFGQPCAVDGGFVPEFWDLVTTELGAVGATHADWLSAPRMGWGLIGPYGFACLELRTCDAVAFDYAVARNFMSPSAVMATLPPAPEPASGEPAMPPLPALRGPNEYVFTAPFWFDTWTGLVLQTRREESDLWGSIEPFAVSLWVALLVFLVAVAMLKLLAAVLTRSAERPRSLRRLPAAFGHSLYHTLGTCLGGEEYVYHSSSTRLLRLGMLAVVLVLQATFTANLAAIFTRPVFETSGPANMAELRRSIACHSFPPFAEYVRPYVRKVLVPPSYWPNGTIIPDVDKRAWWQSLFNLYLALEARAFVCTTGSNWCRLINELRKTRLGVDSTIFVDLCHGEW